MNKKIIFLICLAVVAIASFLFVFLTPRTEPEEISQAEPPRLFGEDDYQVEQRTDGKYIVISKIGFSAKTPDGWKIEKQKTPDLNESQYWVDLLSPDATDLTKKSYLDRGCGISINAGTEEENNTDIKKNIENIKAGTENTDLGQTGYQYEIIKIGQYEALQWLSSEKPIIGQFTGIDVPIDNIHNVNFDATFPPGYKDQCQTVWETFIKTIKIEPAI